MSGDEIMSEGNPNCIGYWWTNIPAWNPKWGKGKGGKHWVDYIRDLPGSAPGKIRYAEFLAAPGPHEDVAFLRLIAQLAREGRMARETTK